jgi:predicted lipid-binding transport protein (Tim44 family)
MFMSQLSRRTRVLALVSSVVLVVASVGAEARPGGKSSSGSRGDRTNSAPSATTTAPTGATPMQRTTAPPSAPNTNPAAQAARPGVPAAAAAAQAAKPSFARNMMMGIGAGLLGAGLFGLLSGSGLMGGLGSLASLFGLLLQAGLIVGAIYLVMRFIRSRRPQNEPALAGVGPGPLARQSVDPRMSGMVGGAAMGGSAAAMAAPAPQAPLQLSDADFGVFETRLREVMDGYSRADKTALDRVATEEMVNYFGEDIAENNRKGLVDESRDVKLVQGDLSEAWREGALEYATVAMRFSLINVIRERATGKIVEGHADIPQEATEYWTFVRSNGAEWKLSAIQQTA